MEMEQTALLVIGAGPYSIATAAYAQYLGATVTVVGKTLDFWKTNVPRGMFLRSGPDWHIDARDVATFEAYGKMCGLTHAQVKPVPRDTFLDYASWFMGRYNVTPRPLKGPDWSWVQPMVRRTLEDHGWWRRSTHEEQEKIRNEFWAVGRLLLEAWLGPRVHQPNIHLHEKTVVVSARTLADGTYDVLLDDDTTVNVHHIILATGYLPNMQNVAFLDHATILQELQTLNGSPVLDTEFQTNLPNLYVTGLAAMQDFGPFFGFTVGCPVAARIVGEAVAENK